MILHVEDIEVYYPVVKQRRMDNGGWLSLALSDFCAIEWLNTTWGVHTYG